MEEIMNEEVMMEEEIAEYEDSLTEEEKKETAIDTNMARLARQRNSRRKAASKNADFESKKASKKEARIEKNSDVHGHCPMKPKHVAYFKTARRRAMRRQANKLIVSEE